VSLEFKHKTLNIKHTSLGLLFLIIIIISCLSPATSSKQSQATSSIAKDTNTKERELKNAQGKM
jgi:hypothetical protein